MLRHAAAIAFVLILSLAGCNGDEEKKATNRVRILATTDEHSHLLAVAPEKDEWPLPSATTTRDGALKGGVARRATVFERERADGVPTVVLSNGDYSQGTLSSVAYTVANFDVVLMRKLGYDAIALGNHEFDLGPAKLVSAVNAAKSMGGAPPFVLTNATFSPTSAADDSLAAIYGDVGSGKDVVKAVVVDKGGIKVGVVSAIGPSAAYDAQYQAAPVTFSTANLGAAYPAYVAAATASIAAILQPVITDLRANRGAQVVVLLFHGGLHSTGSNGDVDLLVPLLSGVDLVVSGHTHGLPPAGTELIADFDGRDVPVMQAAPYGNQVLRAEFTVGGARPTFDASRDAFLAVDDTLPPTGNQEIRYGLSTAVSSIEASVLQGTLSIVTGRTIGDDPLVAGDLYFFPLGHTTFDVTGATLPRETNALNLDTDAMLATAQGLGGAATVALQNAGSIRGDLVAGDTGTIGFSDVFRMVSLGGDPIEGSPGFPLVEVYIAAASLRAAFEQTLQMSYLNNDYYLGSAGVAATWDPTRTAFTCDFATPATCVVAPGWLTSFAVTASDGSTATYDPATYAASGGWGNAAADATKLVPVVTPLLVAAFAGNMNVTLMDSAGNPIDITDPVVLESVILKWPATGSPHVKDHQALARYIAGACAANGGELPALYDAAVPNRVVMCPAGVCP